MSRRKGRKGKQEDEVPASAEIFQKLLNEVQQDKRMLAELETEVESLRDQMQSQSEFTYKLSAVLGDYVKEASKDMCTVNTMIKDPAFDRFVDMLRDMLTRVKTRNLGKENEDDGRYIISMLTVLHHISLVPEGQDFMLSEKFEAILEVLLAMLAFPQDAMQRVEGEPSPFGMYIKVSILKTLSNLCKNPIGLKRLQGKPELLECVSEGVSGQTWNHTRKPALEMLEVITKNVEEQPVARNIVTKVDMKDLTKMTLSADAEVKRLATAAVDAIHVAAQRFNISIK